MNTYCNPLNLEYKFQHYGNYAHREAADPTLILFKDKYYLFVSMSAGFYYSDDLLNWKWHENRNLELYHYAPDIRQVGDYLVFCASDRFNSTIWRTKDLFVEEYEKVSEPFPFWDPDIFEDDDKRVYLYWGCDCGRPIYGIELDNKTFLPIGEKKELIFGNPLEHGFERLDYTGHEKKKQTLGGKLFNILIRLSGRDPNAPFIEGAYMNKINGKYYLQYAAPATEANTYCNGVYIGESALGPFKYQSHNPFSSKPGGFITGAGHGSTINDKYGNLWHTASMRISVNANFERRIGLFPCGIDKDGILYCNQNFADWPMSIPNGKFDPLKVEPEYMLLSYKKKASSSSSLDNHDTSLALNEDIRTSWCAKGSKDEWFKLDLEKEYDVFAIQINFADVNVPILHMPKEECADIQTSKRYIDSGRNLHTRYLLEGSLDDNNWFVLEDKKETDDNFSNDYFFYKEGIKVRYLRITVKELPYNENFALSGFRVFGKTKGEVPNKVKEAKSEHLDDRTVKLEWPKEEGALGYNVRYGIAKDKLYSSYLVYENNEVILTLLNKNQEYYYAIDSFNEVGINKGEVFKV